MKVKISSLLTLNSENNKMKTNTTFTNPRAAERQLLYRAVFSGLLYTYDTNQIQMRIMFLGLLFYFCALYILDFLTSVSNDIEILF